MKISKRAQQITQSEIRAMSILCNEVNGINMAQGLCDLKVPDVVQAGAKEAIEMGKNVYTSAFGEPYLRAAIGETLTRNYGRKIEAENVLISNGATGAFYCLATTLFDEGDEIILFEPYYGYHVSTLESLGCKIKYLKTLPPNYEIDFAKLEDAISERTRAILICNPSNPSGKVFSKEEMSRIAEIVGKNDLYLISDEIYEHFVYDGLSFTSALSLQTIKDRVVAISGFSKIFSVTGWRIGYAICDESIINAASEVNDLVYVCPASPLQYGVNQGVKYLPKQYYTDVAREHQQKRDKFISTLNEVGLPADYVKGAYYVLADLSSLPGDDDKEKVLYLLKKTSIASVPARAFFSDPSGINLARFCFSKKEEELDEACRRLRKHL